MRKGTMGDLLGLLYLLYTLNLFSSGMEAWEQTIKVVWCQV